MPAGASAFYARNISALLLGMVKDGALHLDFEDEVTKATVITQDGAVVSERRQEAAATPEARHDRPKRSTLLLTALTIFTLAILVGFAVISKVPATLHTPLMSGANSIHGIVLVGAMLIAAEADDPVEPRRCRSIAVAFATMNVVGGYVVTDRMLQMFRKKPVAPKPGRRGGGLTVTTLDIIEILVRIAWLGGRRRVRHRPDPDELAGHGPQRQPAVGRRHDARDRRDRRS